MVEVNRRKLSEMIRRKRKLVFLRNIWWKLPKFRNDLKWRKPKGNDNPMRLKLKGYPPVASVGYGTQNVIRGLHPKGLKPIVVHTVRDLQGLNPKDVVIYVASNVGLRKRVEIVSKARELGFLIANE